MAISLMDGTDAKILIKSLSDSRGGDYTEDEAETVIRWAVQSRLQKLVVDYVLKGHIRIDIADNKVRAILTEEGLKDPDGIAKDLVGTEGM